jgi:uncharacterized protein
MATVENVARMVRLNGGRIVGKTRLQKTAYFLEALGVGFGLEFDYHHYGPYSEELANLADDAKALGMLDIQPQRSLDGAEYSIFVDKGGGIDDDKRDETRRAVLRVLESYPAVELELAATADFLEKHGYGPRAWDEMRYRKASKISADRVARARRLLDNLKTATR